MPTQLRKMSQKVVNMAPKWVHLGAMLGSESVSRYQKTPLERHSKKDREKVEKRSKEDPPGGRKSATARNRPDVSPSNSPYLADALTATSIAARQARERYP